MKGVAFDLESGNEQYRLSENTLDGQEREGDPGVYPYTRGLYRDMYRKRHWTMRQYAGYSSATESNEIWLRSDRAARSASARRTGWAVRRRWRTTRASCAFWSGRDGAFG